MNWGIKMKVEDLFSWRRARMILVMFILTVLSVIALGIIYKIMPDRILAFIFAGMVFFAFYVYGLEINRVKKGILDEAANNFKRIAVFYSISILFTVICAVIPLKADPVLAATILMALVTNQFLGLTVAVFLIVLQIYLTSGSVAVLCCYLIMAIGGVLISEGVIKRRNRFYVSLLVFVTSVCLPCIFSFLENFTVDLKILLSGGISGLLNIALLLIFVPQALKGRGERKINSFSFIISEKYPLVRDLKVCSQEEYELSRKIEELSYGCALAAGCKEEVCRAAGFYYRIGLLEEKPHIKNGIQLAERNYFPHEVIEILSEYNGEENVISTPESAIVHICAYLLLQMHSLDKVSLANPWDREIAIYQITNFLSESGIYDKSGLGMNMFIKVREYLIREARFDDNNSNK